MQLYVLVVLVVAAAVGLASAADFNPRRALLDYLKEKSDCEVPPSPEALPVKVQVSIKLMRILDSCPDKYCVKLQLLEMYNWTDPRLKWNPDNYGGVEYMPIDVDYLWLPDVDIAGDKKGHSMRKRFQDDKATVLSSGSVLLIAPQKYDILCNSSVWEESIGSGGSSSSSKKSKSSSSINRRGGSDPRQRQLQMRRASESGANGKQYTCEFYQTSWYYDTDTVEVVPATPEEQEGRQPSRPREMRIRDGGPSRRGSSSSFGEGEEEQDNESEQDESESTYPWSRQQQTRQQRSQRSQSSSSNRRTRRQESSNGKNGKNGKNGSQPRKTKKIPFSEWTSTACKELFEPNEKYDLSDFTAYREFNSLPYAPDRQWSMVYYRIGIVDKKPEEHEEEERQNKSSKTNRKQVNRQQQTEEEEDETNEEEEQQQRRDREQSSSSSDSNNNVFSKRDLKRRNSSKRSNGRSSGRKTAQIDTSAMVQEDESADVGGSW